VKKELVEDEKEGDTAKNDIKPIEPKGNINIEEHKGSQGIEPLDDISSDEDIKVNEFKDTIIGQFTKVRMIKVTRMKKKEMHVYKCNFVNCYLNLNGKDYISKEITADIKNF